MIITPEQITNQRKQLNLSQKQLSELTGIPQGNISRIEKGLYNPTEETLRKIAEALDILHDKGNETIENGQNQFDNLTKNFDEWINEEPEALEDIIKRNAEQTGMTYEKTEEMTHRILAFLEEYRKICEINEQNNFESETKEG